MSRILPILADKNSKEILASLCKEHRLSMNLLKQMIAIQRDNLGRGKQIGITQDFSAAIADFIEEETA